MLSSRTLFGSLQSSYLSRSASRSSSISYSATGKSILPLGVSNHRSFAVQTQQSSTTAQRSQPPTIPKVAEEVIEEEDVSGNLLTILRNRFMKGGFGGLTDDSKGLPPLVNFENREVRKPFQLPPRLAALSKNKRKKKKHLFVYQDKAPKNETDLPVQDYQVIPAQDLKLEQPSIGRFEAFTSADIAKYFPEGFAGRYAEQSLRIKKTKAEKAEAVDLLVRQEFLKLVQEVQSNADSNFTKYSHKILHGQPGVGKSGVLNHLVYWARKNNYIVVFAKDLGQFIDGQGIQESFLFPNVYGQQDRAVALCKALLDAHADKFSKIPLRTSFTIKGFKRTPTSTVADLLNWGANPPKHEGHVVPISSDVIFQFRQELNEITEYPVLIVADGINKLYWRGSRFYDPDIQSAINPRQLLEEDLVLASCFKDFQKHGLKRGMYVGALTSEVPDTRFRAMFFENSTNFYPVRVAPLRKKELYNIIDYFEDNKYISSKVPTGTRDYLDTFFGGRGHEVFKYCSSLLA
eukprot:TRINITY_DN5543_c0_g1_i1.p1 TRINITY_DN5543_c0_g1~~TRINITY_DN5543_c0_g1_i1.p1  ORF type:complete len:518 (-),score=113.22 TRINITY_DN5543_c0_g1_i1:283-1836(-)